MSDIRTYNDKNFLGRHTYVISYVVSTTVCQYYFDLKVEKLFVVSRNMLGGTCFANLTNLK